MATRSTIAVKLPTGTVLSVYCHSDGYLSHNGRMLLEYYNVPAIAEELVSHGDMSLLGPSINPVGAHSFAAPEAGVTVYYGRDCGERDTEPRRHSDESMYKVFCEREEFNYYFDGQIWYVARGDKGSYVVLSDYVPEELS